MKPFALVTALLLSVSSLLADKPGWSDNYAKSLETAKADDKLVLLDFTGSDWCGWCMKLDKEVFSTPEFKSYAEKNLVLVELDFPQNKPQTAEVKKQNAELQQKYGIQGYPTIVVLNSKGKKVGELGYMPGGPAAFIGELKKLKNH